MNAFLRNSLVQALCRTLLHSLWQGLLLALLAGLVLVVLRRSSAALRYRTLVLLLIVFSVAAVLRFNQQYQLAISTLNSSSSTPGASITGIHVAFTFNASFADKMKSLVDRNSWWIVLIWFVVFAWKLMRLLLQLFYTNKLRCFKTADIPADWKTRLGELAKSIGINGTVSLVQSRAIQVPMVLGIFKPIVLIPMSLLTQLPKEELENILLHELAHIRRKDYLVNLLQCLAETVFFFNPGVRWLSMLIREEREHACDDLVIEVTHDKPAFVNALIAFLEYRAELSLHSVAFTGRKNSLLRRVKRMVAEGHSTLFTSMEKSLLGLCLGLILLVFLVRTETVSATTVAKVLAGKTNKAVIVSPLLKTKLSPEHKQMLTVSVDTLPKNEAERLTEKIRQIKSHGDSLARKFSLIEVNPDHESKGLQVRVVQRNSNDTISYRLIEGKRSDLSLNNNALSFADSLKYKATIVDAEDAVRYRGNAREIQKEFSAAVKQEANIRTQEKLEAMQKKQKLQKLPPLTKLAPG